MKEFKQLSDILSLMAYEMCHSGGEEEVVEKLKSLKHDLKPINDLIIELISFVNDVKESSSTSYDGHEDEIGSCIHCCNISYKPHEADCLISKARELSKRLTQV